MNLKSPKLFNFIIIATLLFVAGCSKSSSKTRAEYLASSSWKYSAAGIDQDGNGTIDIAAPSSLVEACLTDNTITFKADKTGNIDEGSSKCDASDPQIVPFTWELSNNDTQLTLSTSIVVGIGNDAKVVEITDSRLVLSKTLTVAGFPVPVPVVVVLVH
ncbi:MAG: lipocalin family protein [Chitinophagaceae bacterium]